MIDTVAESKLTTASQCPVGSSAIPEANDPPEEVDVLFGELAISDECTMLSVPPVESTCVLSALKVNAGIVVAPPAVIGVTNVLASMLPSAWRG